MSRLPVDYVPNGTRKIVANGAPKVGGFTRGNASSTYLGRANTTGLLATVGNPVGGKPSGGFRPKPPSAETRHAQIVEERFDRAKPCPGCGMKTIVPKTCFCW